MKISTKLVGSVLLIFVVAFASLAYVVDHSAQDALVTEAGQRLELVKRARVDTIESLLSIVSNSFVAVSRSLWADAMLRQLPHATGSTYAALRSKYHPMVERYAKSYQIEDVVLASPDGDVLYSMRGTANPGVSLVTGPWHASRLSVAFELARASTRRDTPSFVDFGPSQISGVQTCLLSVPVFDGPGHALLGIVVAALPLSAINRIVTERAGFGKTQDTYLVGPDERMRSQSRTSGLADVREAVRTEAVRRALANEGGTIQQENHRGIAVLSSYAPVHVGGQRWALVEEMDLDEVLIPARALHDRILWLLLALSLAGGVVVIAVLRVVILSPISRLTAAARRIEAGNLEQPLEVTSDDELGQLARVVNTMMTSVRASLLRTRQQLADSQTGLRDVAARLNHVRERERAQMAGDIHDHLGQALTTFKLDIAEVRRRLAVGNHAGADARLKEMVALADGAIDDTRRLAAELRPTAIDEVGAVEAMRGYLFDYSRRTGIDCEFNASVPDPSRLSTNYALALFRILQEALTNITRHAHARHVSVFLEMTDCDIVLTVHDDGSGIGAPGDRRGFGLVNMRDRALLFGGDVAVKSGRQGGTTIEARLPMAFETPA